MLFFCRLFTTLYAQNQQDFNLLGGDDGPRLSLSGEVIGMYTLGLAEDEQVIIPSNLINPSGIYENLDGKDGKNGYFTKVDFSLLFSPVSFIDIFVKFYARYRPGSPYIPLQLEGADKEYFSLYFDNAWGRVNAVKGLGFDIPLDIFLKVGKFDSTPASFQNISMYGTESVMGRIRTKNTYALQLEALYALSFADSVSFTGATSQKLNEGTTPLYDTDGSQGEHGQPIPEDLYDIPLFAALKFNGIATGLGPVSAEVVYAYNAEGIYSGHNYGLDGKWEISIPGIDGLLIPVGAGIALMEKNIDPLAAIALGIATNIDSNNALAASDDNVNDKNNFNTISFRRSFRMGLGLGARYNLADILQTEINIGYAFSQLAHIYRDTIGISSLSIDLRAIYDNRYIFGGGIFLGTLGEAEWKTSSTTNPTYESNYSHIFTPAENLGFEVYGGLKFKNSRLVLGYNLNKGLSMNYGLESMPDAQVKYKQKRTVQQEELFERGGFFTKLIISW